MPTPDFLEEMSDLVRDLRNDRLCNTHMIADEIERILGIRVPFEKPAPESAAKKLARQEMNKLRNDMLGVYLRRGLIDQFEYDDLIRQQF